MSVRARLGFGVGNYSVDWVAAVMILLIVGVALGGSRDSSIRRVPVHPEA